MIYSGSMIDSWNIPGVPTEDFLPLQKILQQLGAAYLNVFEQSCIRELFIIYGLQLTIWPYSQLLYDRPPPANSETQMTSWEKHLNSCDPPPNNYIETYMDPQNWTSIFFAPPPMIAPPNTWCAWKSVVSVMEILNKELV